MSQKIYTNLDIKGNTTIGSITNATTDTDKFLVSDNGLVKYRTGAEMLSDLGVNAGAPASTIQHQVKAAVAINKGQAVYVSSADGTNMIVSLASNATEATSSKTMGLLADTVAINGFSNVVAEGLLAGLNTSTAAAGDPVWLGTGGNLIYGLINKPYAPAHLVFIGIVTRVNINNGEIFVKVQNGFELDELHDVDLKTTTPVNGHILGHNGTLWVNKTIAGWLGYTPANANGTTNYLSKFTGSTTLGNSLVYDNGTNVLIGTTTDPNYAKLVVSGGNIIIDNNAQFLSKRADGLVLSVFKVNTAHQLEFNPTYGQGLSGYLFSINGSQKMTLTSGGSLTATADMRAPIFYDSDNTNYYLDPAASSNLYDITANKFVKAGGTASQFLKADGTVDSNTYLTSVTNISGYSGTLISEDNRTISPSELAANRLKFGFTSWNNNNSGPYADFLHMRSYQDASGGLDNLVMFRKDAIGMRIWQQTYGSATAYSSYKDISFTDGTNATGTWPISITGSATSAGSVDFNNLTNKTGGTGTYQTSGDFRAPIFYDSDNTGYYVNPAFISNFNTVLGTSIQVQSISPALVIQDTDSSGAAQVGYISYRNTSGAETAWEGFGSSLDTDFSIRNTLGRVLLNGTYSEAVGDFRAPIFYDSDNTAYYTNPNGTSSLSLLIADNIIKSRKPQIDNDYTTAAIWTESYSTTTTGVAFHISGLVGKFLEMRTNGILYWDNSIVWHAGNDGSGSGLDADLLDGNHASAFALASHTHPYDNYQYWNLKTNGVQRTTITSNGSLDLVAGTNVSLSYGAGGVVTISSTDTNTIYTHPAYTARSIDTSGAQVIDVFTSDAIGSVTNITTRTMTLADLGYTGATNANYYVLPFTDNSANWNTAYSWGNHASAGYATAATNRWYDGWVTNPGYDANTIAGSKSGFTYANNAPYSGPLAHIEAGGYGLQFNAPYSSGGYGITFRTRNGDAGTWNPWQYPAVYGVNVNGGGALYALIYYDTNNTAYYLDPASTSNLLGLTVTNTITGNISGNANYATTAGSADQIDGVGFRNTGSNSGINADTLESNGITYYTSGVPNFTGNATDGALYSQAYSAAWQHQIAGDFRSGQIAIRGKNSGTWQAWRTVLDSSNISSYAASTSHTHTFDSLTSKTGGTGTYQTSGDFRAPIFYDSDNTAYFLNIASTSEVNKVYYNSNMVSRNYGLGQVGVYNASRYQAVFSMGESYILPADGTTTGSLYGMAWSHPNAGGVAGNLNTHGLLVMENGTFLAAISGSIRSRDDMRAPIFYDSNNTAYYINPADTTTSANFQSKITIQGGSSAAVTMVQVVNSYGSPSIGSYYGSLTTSSTLYVGSPTGTLYDAYGQNARFSLYYDRDNTSYYVDPATTSVLNRLSISFNDATYQSGIAVTNTNTGAQAIAGLSMTSGAYNGSINMFSSGYMDILNQNTTNGAIQFRPRATVSMNIDNVSSTSRVTIGSNNTASHPLRVTQQVSNVSIYADYDIVAYSDQSVKENIRPIENVLDRVNKSRGVVYDRIDSGEKNNIGFIAQELEVEFPELVVTNEDNTKAVKYQNAVAVLFEAVKEQQKQIEELKELVNKLITK